MAAPAVKEQAAYVPADLVGSAFAMQYYSILRQSPELVYRFYQDLSKLGRPQDDDGVMGSITTMTAIDEKIQSYGRLNPDVKFVDAQESYNGGVIVLVTGSMVNEYNSRRGFTQTFFLAPQEKGYYVLNDIFRYLEDDTQHSKKQDDGIAPSTPIQEETPVVQENHISEQANGEVYNPTEDGEVPVEEEPVAEVVGEVPNEPQVVDEVPNETRVVESNAKVEEVLKKSYASIVMKVAVPTSPPNLPKSVPKVQEQQVPAAPAPHPVAVDAPVADVDDGNNHESEGDAHSIYVRNLPINASYALVEEEFKRFGPIKSGGIQIRINKGFCFGFVEFEVPSAVRSAIEASPITIGGREVVIEEKKSTNSRGNSRGRFQGRVGGFRGEGGRGRGSYGGGRGYSRGESNKNDFGNRGSSRGYQSRGVEGYQRGEHMGNGAGRVNRGGGGPGFGAARAQRVPAQA